MTVSPQELSFTHCGKRFAGKRWGNGRGIPVLALHGWLDNSASFDLLAPRLTNTDFVAIDLAGHGQSDFRSEDSGYNIWQDLGDLISIMDQLEWHQCVLLGHSRGASIATLLAAAYPKRVSTLILLDNFLPAPVRGCDAPQQLANSINDKQKYLNRKSRVYSTFEAAVAARSQSPLPLPINAINALALRGVVKTADGYVWRADPRLQGASELKLNQQHIDGIVAALVCPTYVLLGSKSQVIDHGEIRKQVAANQQIQLLDVEGGHHFHMEAGVESIAQQVKIMLPTP